MTASVKSYLVLSALMHNGKTYYPDIADKSTVDMTLDEAAPLIALKVLGADTAEEVIDLPIFDLGAELSKLMVEGVSIPTMGIGNINKLLSQPAMIFDVIVALKSIKVAEDAGAGPFDLVAELEALIQRGEDIADMNMDGINALLTEKVKRAEVTAALDKINTSKSGN